MSTEGKWQPLFSEFAKGDPIAKLSAYDIARVFRIINTIEVHGGTLVKSSDGYNWKLIIGQDANGAMWPWMVYLGGVRFGPFQDHLKNFIRVRVDSNTVTESAGPMPSPMPPGEEWYDKRSTPRGDIHVTRFG